MSNMKIAMETLELDNLTIIYPGNDSWKLARNISVFGLKKYLEEI
jgi:hypothetical protein